MSDKSIFKVGLTGGMGCGKSVVRKMLENMGLPAIDADSLAKQIAQNDPEAIEEIKSTFGADVYDDMGQLRRQKLAAKVFGKPEALEKLNRILHPRVMATVDRILQTLAERGKELVIIEAALFYEVGWDKAMDRMVVVTAPLEKRIAWLQKRDGLTREQIEARLSHQMPVEEKAVRAHFVIRNDGSLDDLRDKVENLKQKLILQSKP